MEWGIINEENFKDIYDIPLKRWDPLSTVIIRTEGFGLRNERIRRYGHYSFISPIRGQRPKSYKSDKNMIDHQDCSKKSFEGVKDVFMVAIEGKPLYHEDGRLIGDGYTIIITEDEKRQDNPFKDEPHRIKRISSSCKALTLINRYPSMARVVDPKINDYILKNLPSHLKFSRGINLVSLSRDFYPSFCLASIPEDVLSGIMLSMKAAILYCVQEAINKDYYDIPISPFFNIGSKAGGSQPRIHGQVYIDLNMDGHGRRLEGYLEAFKEMGDDCHLCKTTHGDSDRIIMKTPFWTFFCTGSPVRNYHIRFYPKEHIRRFSKLNPNQIQDMAKSLKIIFKALDDIGVEKNRNILFNSCPYGYDASFHFFGDIIPHETIGGAEMAEDMRVARRLPHQTAAEIRNAISIQ